MRRLVPIFVFLLVAVALALPASAKGKPEKAGKPRHLVQVAKPDKSAGRGGAAGAGVVFDEKVRGAVENYAATARERGSKASKARVHEARSGGAKSGKAKAGGVKAGKHCPPGLAAKNNGCLPPGQAKKRYAIGEAVEEGVDIEVVPPRLRVRLPDLLDDSFYGVIDGDLVRVARATGKVLEAVEIATGR